MSPAVARALAKGEHVVMTRSGESVLRLSDADEADRKAGIIGGYALHPQRVAA
ncbi:hypothetical protein [Microbacterium oleivorans]|uniref:hypothetical protein n=1 Tax=Microbacterium oleivorans TaxID=273677 RepID=UPI0014054ECE|nr:hypothetical protein [Microbacterium oleivorans]